jgi:hypothetical protein
MISNWLGQRILHGSQQFSEKLIKCPTTARKREKETLSCAADRVRRKENQEDDTLRSNRSLFPSVILIFLLSLAALGGPRESGAGELEATWMDNSSNEDGFKIERRTGTTQTFTEIAILGTNVTSYNDSGLVDGETYCYRVLAFNAAGSSPYSNEECAVARPDARNVLLAAVLPSSRSVQVGTVATAFATIINRGHNLATACSIAPFSGVAASFHYQTTDPNTNQITGSADTPVDIASGGFQSFIIAFMPTQTLAPTDSLMMFQCANTDSAPINTGLNTLLLSASAIPVPDIVALAATPTNDGIVNIPGATGTGAFAVATVNVGASGSITASADTGSATLPVHIFLCQTNPANGQCISAIGPNVTTQINANATPTFGIFVQGNGIVPFDPAGSRIFVRFRDSSALTRGSTSVAVRTQ